jgi:hypothetical protein
MVENGMEWKGLIRAGGPI